MSDLSRREFVKAGSSTAALLASTPLVYAGGQEATIKIGLVGCGGRGTGAAENCLNAAPNVQIVALGDMFADRIKGSQRTLSKLPGYKV
ncbi:MAG: gfo/Idh/MocA family oxidoreductase, partial [Planctomycetota bacterium]